MKFLAVAATLIACTTATPAHAAEIFGGLFVHDVDTPLTKSGIEDGADLQIGFRADRLGPTPLQPYAYATLNSSGETSYGAIGLSAKFGDSIYIRPGLGLALHSGSSDEFEDPTNDEIEFGSRILFAPEVSVGARIAPRVSVEASWVHLSHAQLFSRQNPGIDNFGVRLNLAL